jgi:hypothetical protein
MDVEYGLNTFVVECYVYVSGTGLYMKTWLQNVHNLLHYCKLCDLEWNGLETEVNILNVVTSVVGSISWVNAKELIDINP